ncbi:unnamed protein product [Cunninghamella blakesleeana]
MSLSEVIKSNGLRIQLEKAGYTSIKEIENKRIFSLTKELGLSKEEINELLPIIQKKLNNEGITANHLLEEQIHGISISCQRMNMLLGTNKKVPKCSITEISGETGTGKTTLCIDLALNVQLPIDKGGMDGQCIYIDTEGSLSKDRLVEISQHSKAETNLNKIHVFRVVDHIELIALIRQLPNILQDIPNVKLIVIDSMAFLFRFNIKEHKKRVQLLNYSFQSLIHIANNHNVVIVATNHITTNPLKDTLQPMQGDSWGQWCMQRLILGKKGHKRYAHQYKPNNQPNDTLIPFIITEKGLEDDDDTWHLINESKPQKEEEEEQEEVEEKNVLLGKINKLDTEIDGDAVNIWEEQGLSDEIILELPSQISSGDSFVKEEESYIIVPDSQPDHTYSAVDDNSDDFDTYDIPPPRFPLPLSPLSKDLSRKRKSDKDHPKQPPPQEKSSSTLSINNHFDKADIYSDNDEDEDEDEWLALICASSPPY